MALSVCHVCGLVLWRIHVQKADVVEPLCGHLHTVLLKNDDERVDIFKNAYVSVAYGAHDEQMSDTVLSLAHCTAWSHEVGIHQRKKKSQAYEKTCDGQKRSTLYTLACFGRSQQLIANGVYADAVSFKRSDEQTCWATWHVEQANPRVVPKPQAAHEAARAETRN